MGFLCFYHVVFFCLFVRKGKSYVVSVEEDAQILFQFCIKKEDQESFDTKSPLKE